MINLAELVKRGFAHVGVGFTRVSNTLPYRRQQFFRDLNISVVLDVGANTGQYAAVIRQNGYEGRLVSFEPLSTSFVLLAAFAKAYPDHSCLPVALGRTDGTAEINVSQNFASSSLLSVSDECVAACPDARRVGTETIQLRRLDTVRADILKPTDRVHLKIDTQGTEKDVLSGGADTLSQVVSIEVELSFAPLYDQQPLFAEMFQFLESLSFRCVWIERGFMSENSGHLLQVDGLFVRMDSLPSGAGAIS